MPLLRATVQRSRENRQKHQFINETENILMRVYTTAGVQMCINFFFMVHIKSLVYDTPVPLIEGNARIFVASERIRDVPGIFQKLSISMQRTVRYTRRLVTNIYGTLSLTF
ncbi:hypothetical protein TNCV_2452401 [Trichonephila clavipes]|nr:hypothetical protein TNCV_2452401 [Trichonephila clavipes]